LVFSEVAENHLP